MFTAHDPPLNIARSTSTCNLSIINTTCNITAPSPYLIEPQIAGHEYLNLPTYAFHITHASSNRQLLFDLGARKDWQNSPPHVSGVIANLVPGLKVDRNVIDILDEGGVDINDVEALILSHWHFDHSGDLAALPKSVQIIVGPGFCTSFLPGWPSNEKSPFHEASFSGRIVTEAPFSSSNKIGEFESYDYFGDGSLFILNVPGHTIGHISCLVRTTGDTFVLLGGDVFHFGGVARPSPYLPLPEYVPKETPLDKRLARPCPCSIFEACHPNRNDSRTTPFYKVSSGASTWYEDPKVAQESVMALQAFDACEDILVAISHETAALEVFTFFPQGNMNEWKEKGWKEALHWGFLGELPFEGRGPQNTLVDGLYKNGEKIKDLKL